MGRCKTATTYAGALIVSLAGAAFSPAFCGGAETETPATTKTKDAPATSVTQDMLNASAGDEKNFLLLRFRCGAGGANDAPGQRVELVATERSRERLLSFMMLFFNNESAPSRARVIFIFISITIR